MRKTRRLHLWIGLFTSFLILIEAITGLILLEPKLIGIDMPKQQQMHGPPGIEQTIAAEGMEGEKVAADRYRESAGQGFGAMAFIKNLHAGRIGNADVSILLELVAAGLIILTVTGMLMSIKALKLKRP